VDLARGRKTQAERDAITSAVADLVTLLLTRSWIGKSRRTARAVAQNIPLRQPFTAQCLKEVSRFPDILTRDVAFDRVR
jgi:hypothetical protein